MSHKQSFIDKCYKDKSGKVVLGQKPNVPIIAWIVCKLLGYLHLAASVDAGLAFLATAFLFTWAYLEISSGVNYARRLLGLLVLIAIVVPQF